MTVYLALGSNLGDRLRNIEMAYKRIEERVGRVTSSSAFYFSKPVGFESEHDFVNSACEVRSNLDIDSLFEAIQGIEKEMGRVRKSDAGGYTDRIIDIDLLLAGDRVINTPRLVIPHPRMHERDFVLLPLNEIAPNAIHPVLQKSIQELTEELRSKTAL
ncbi:MAG: 2-amino-4-hydroxy-6-hydroxymethyldihydropteridine diphosphokinase [Fermentimonas sp.]